MIAIALACEPKVLLADEPTTALDVTIQAQILALLDDLEDRLGMATLLVTHDMGVVAGRTNRISVMYAGRIVETASTEEIFSAMRHPYTQALLGSIPRLEPGQPTKALVSIPGLPARPDEPAARLPLRAALPVRHRQVPRARSRRWPARDPDHLFACWHPVDGPVERTEGVVAVRRRPPPQADASNGHLLEIVDVVREYPVTAGAILQRKVNSVKAVSGRDRCTSTPARRSAWSASRAAARPRSGKLIVGIEKPDAGRITLDGPRGVRHARQGAAPRATRPADDVPGPLRVARPADARAGDPARAAGHPEAWAAARSRTRRSGSCSTRSACRRTRSSAIRTSSPAASASGSRWPER